MEQNDMNILDMSKEDFKNVPLVDWTKYPNEWIEFSSAVIIPTENIHDSGFRCMDYVLLDAHCKILGRVSVGSDVTTLYLDDYTFETLLLPSARIDCIPCGYTRLFCGWIMKVNRWGCMSEFTVHSSPENT